MLTTAIILCTSLYAIDGDTAKCDGTNLSMLGNGTPYIDGVDTPESGKRAKCPYERQLAEKATRRFAELLQDPNLTIEDSGERGPFNRPLVRFRLGDGRTAGSVLISEDLARVWHRGRHIDWCR